MNCHSGIAMLPATLLFLLICSAPARAEKLTKVEIGKIGKAATAYIEVPHKGSGTAFCIHADGLFITNEHVIRGAEKSGVTLVLDPALKSQRILKARVTRVDKELDLALLRVDGVSDLASLQLGSVDGVTELMDVVAFGFPLGRVLATDKNDYPTISVNSGRVTALRHKNGELQVIQIDVTLTFGSSGGPILDDDGKVVGVVVSGVGHAQGINQAIPVSNLDRFLKSPEITFTPPALNRATLDHPAEFKARIVSFVPNSPEPTLSLLLKSGEEAERSFPMEKRGSEFVATVVPVSKQDNSRVEITIRLGSGMLAGLVDDAVFKVGDRPMRFSQIRRIEFRPKQLVQLADGKTVYEGAITGLGTVDLNMKDQAVKIDLTKAIQAQVQPPVDTWSVSATIVASVDGKEVARSEQTVPVRDPGQLVDADLSTVVVTPPPLSEDKVVKQLPELFSDVVVGGGGRYLIFHLPKSRKLAIFNVSEARVTNYIPLVEDAVSFAAGLEKVVVGLKNKGAIELWSLSTCELESTVFPTLNEELAAIHLGHGSRGPLVVNGVCLDLDTLRPLPINKQAPLWGARDRRFPSADGTVFGAWNTYMSPDSASIIAIEGGEIKRYESSGLHHVIPGPDGTKVFTARGVVSRTLAADGAEDANAGYCLPAMRGPYYLSMTSSDGAKGGTFTVHLLGQKRPVLKLGKVNHGIRFDGWDREQFGPWKRVFFIPDANVIAVLPPSNDQIVLYKIDVDAALEQSGIDYLLVTSQPPRMATADVTWTYPIIVKAKHPAVTFHLDAGPRGMVISKMGLVEWPVPADAPAGIEDVILTIKDGKGQEIFHTFTVRVVK